MITGALVGACSRLATLMGCGVPSISSGGISVVSGILLLLVAAEASAELESVVSVLFPQALKKRADALRTKRLRRFIFKKGFKVLL